MPDTNDLIMQYTKLRHPLTSGFSPQEAERLVDGLRRRLDSSTTELDLSPISLKRLEQKLVVWHSSLQQQNRILTAEEVLQLVREIAAYFGLVLMNHVGGKWRTLGTLWLTEILIEGPIRVQKDGQSRISPYRLVLSLGNQAATTWDEVIQGLPLRLHKEYSMAKRKIAKDGK